MTDLITPSELAGLREDVEQLFSYEGRVTRDKGPGTLNPDTSQYENPPDPELIYSGPYFLSPIISRRDRFDEFGQGLIFTRQYRVILPWDEAEIQVRDEFVAITSDDPQLVDRVMLVRDVMVGSHLGYRRLTVQDVKE